MPLVAVDEGNHRYKPTTLAALTASSGFVCRSQEPPRQPASSPARKGRGIGIRLHGLVTIGNALCRSDRSLDTEPVGTSYQTAARPAGKRGSLGLRNRQCWRVPLRRPGGTLAAVKRRAALARWSADRADTGYRKSSRAVYPTAAT